VKRIVLCIGMAAAALAQSARPLPVAQARANDKKDLSETYKGKYLVVVRDGLPLAICSEGCSQLDVTVIITPSGPNTSVVRSGKASLEPAHKGEVLKVTRAAVHSKFLEVEVESLSAHAITRGVGAFQHESQEYPAATLMFALENGTDQAQLIDQWIKPFDTEEQAAKFGNTASGVFVKEVKLGMTPAEVEAVLGVPETKVDLGDKVLYKYKNMTVEFHTGKVSDVR
jgi:hypothetical protein